MHLQHCHTKSDKKPENIEHIVFDILALDIITDADFISAKLVENERSQRAKVPPCSTEKITPVT